MHRPRHSEVIVKVKLAALLLCLSRLLIPVAVAMSITAVLSGEVRYSKIALAIGASAAVLAVLQWIFASGGKCPLCAMPVLSRKGCSKHRNARCVAGSHRFPVAFGVLFKGHFRCPYCNEPTLLELKATSRRS
ncbi:hypothetical protein OKA05_28350 [Luteolibacter arcticus]|uniref:Uncharacterized protein n=1 Tax=Luteolibacter arcticus TaxID=1581411 RepID=A0ABT3GSI4_9BACT|nr:hypothetical protein [Luteolibacter arcticus]MCW1926496.1 hypothetical protein [Luteolibacter arcticus]